MNRSIEVPKPKPCPICGREPTLITNRSYSFIEIRCEKDRLSVGQEDLPMAIAKWNEWAERPKKEEHE